MMKILLIAYFLASTTIAMALTTAAPIVEYTIEIPTRIEINFILFELTKQKRVNGNLILPKQKRSRVMRTMDYKSTNSK
jgi:hypothetical protein